MVWYALTTWDAECGWFAGVVGVVGHVDLAWLHAVNETAELAFECVRRVRRACVDSMIKKV